MTYSVQAYGSGMPDTPPILLPRTSPDGTQYLRALANANPAHAESDLRAFALDLEVTTGIKLADLLKVAP